MRRDRTTAKLLHALLLHGARTSALTQEEFWHLVVGLDGQPISRNTGGNVVRRLEEAGRLVLRRPLRFGPGLGLVIAVSIGTGSLRAGLFDANGTLLPSNSPAGEGADPDLHAIEEIHQPDQLDLPRDVLLGRVSSAVRRVALRALGDSTIAPNGTLPLLAVATAWPSPLNRWTKVPTGQALPDPAWRMVDSGGDQPLGVDRLVAMRLGLDVRRSHALNDANATALGAAFDRSRAERPDGGPGGGVIMALRIGGGIGAGTVVMGSSADRRPRSQFLAARLLEGTGGYAGEIGHWQVPREDLAEVFQIDPDAMGDLHRRVCACGRDRCLELFAGGRAVEARLTELGVPVETAKDARRRMPSRLGEANQPFADDKRVLRALTEAGRLIGRSLSAPILMLNPESITLSGGLALEPVCAAIASEKGRWEHVHQEDLDLSILGDLDNRYAAARGAALAAFRGRVFRRFDEDDLDLRGLSLTLDTPMAERWPDE